jgi:hypothetical protein
MQMLIPLFFFWLTGCVGCVVFRFPDVLILAFFVLDVFVCILFARPFIWLFFFIVLLVLCWLYTNCFPILVVVPGGRAGAVDCRLCPYDTGPVCD